MTLDNQRFLQYSLYGLAGVLTYVLYKFFGSMVDLVTVAFGLRPIMFLGMDLARFMAVPALLLALGAAEFTRRNETANKFGIEVVSELRKVAWPNWQEVRGTTLVVLGVSAAVAIILFLLDLFYGQLLKLIFGAS
jgi:preprotein translocase SecE subunit